MPNTGKLALAAALCQSHVCAATVQVNLLQPSVLKERLKSGVVRASKRQESIRRQFEAAGCAPEEQAVNRKRANVICTLPGDGSGVILVGGHFDFAELGQGIVDDWSGVALLPALYQALKDAPRHHTFRFIAFAEEEKGLVGSTKYVKSLTDHDTGKIDAFINLECLGLGQPEVWVHRSTPALVSRLLEVANATKISVGAVNVERVGDDDTHPFLSRKIPVISIHSITQQTLSTLHSNRDTLEAIHEEVYYQAYRLVAVYLFFLDQPALAELNRD